MSLIYFDKDITTNVLRNKTVAVIGYGSQGQAQAKNMRDSGINVIIGARENKDSWIMAEEDNFVVLPISKAVQSANIVHILIPDECQEEVYLNDILCNLSPGKTLSFSSAFSIHYKKIIPPQEVNVILIAPKGPGPSVRTQYLNKMGVPGLLAVHQDYTKTARNIGLEMGKSCGLSRSGILETTMKEEIETDLFGEQTILVGGLVELMSASFDTLLKAGYQEESAYFETVNELKLIVDIIYKDGISGMLNAVSNTAKFGWYMFGNAIITDKTKETLKEILEKIQNGTFVNDWDKEYSNNLKNLKMKIEELDNLKIEEVGKRVRKLINSEKDN